MENKTLSKQISKQTQQKPMIFLLSKLLMLCVILLLPKGIYIYSLLISPKQLLEEFLRTTFSFKLSWELYVLAKILSFEPVFLSYDVPQYLKHYTVLQISIPISTLHCVFQLCPQAVKWALNYGIHQWPNIRRLYCRCEVVIQKPWQMGKSE